MGRHRRPTHRASSRWRYPRRGCPPAARTASPAYRGSRLGAVRRARGRDDPTSQDEPTAHTRSCRTSASKSITRAGGEGSCLHSGRRRALNMQEYSTAEGRSRRHGRCGSSASTPPSRWKSRAFPKLPASAASATAVPIRYLSEGSDSTADGSTRPSESCGTRGRAAYESSP